MNDLEEFFFYCIVLVFGAIVWMFISAWTCHSRWEHSQMNTAWGIGKGCTVEVSPGRWIPENRVREIDVPRGKE